MFSLLVNTIYILQLSHMCHLYFWFLETFFLLILLFLFFRGRSKRWIIFYTVFDFHVCLKELTNKATLVSSFLCTLRIMTNYFMSAFSYVYLVISFILALHSLYMYKIFYSQIIFYDITGDNNCHNCWNVHLMQ